MSRAGNDAVGVLPYLAVGTPPACGVEERRA
jgi:hypothetical protein